MDKIKIILLLSLVFIMQLDLQASNQRIILMDYDEISGVSSEVKVRYLKSLCSTFIEQNIYKCPSNIDMMEKEQFKVYWTKFNDKVNKLCLDKTKDSICKKIANVRTATFFAGRAHR